jgi:glycosyltransferase involved in cell wall biosynthesis
MVDGPRTRLAVVIDAPMGEQRDFDIVLNLARRHHVEVVTTQRGVPLHPWLLVNFPPRDVPWLDTNASRFDRLLYLAEVGRVSRVLRELVLRHPGTVVLREAAASLPNALSSTAEVAERAYRVHGYPGLADVRAEGEGGDASARDAFELLDGALGLVLLSRALFDRVREAVGEAAPSLLASATGSAPEVATSISDAMRRFETRGPRSREVRLIDAIADCGVGSVPLTDADLERCATAIAAHRPRLGPPRLLVDVSVLAHRDARTGIQRVVRGILAALLLRAPAAYRVEPIREDGNGRYVHARPLALRMLGLPSEWLQEEPVEACPGDVFLGLDLIADRLPRVESLLARWRVRGVAIHFVVYDLLPVKLPDMFIPELRPIFSAWYAAVSRVANGIVCISRAVADEFLEWIARNPPERSTPLAVGHFPLGASFDDSHPTAGLPADAEQALAALRARPSFLMVGTIEPRKAHPQAVAAFERLWQRGIDANLVIVGQEGWMMTAFAKRLRAHPESGRRLFWFEAASDEMLERVYEASTVLLSASLGEGFGLPLVEAAHRGLPLIARDLPVFREVAGDRAYYFSGDDPGDLARAIEDWLELHRAGRAPDSAGVDAITWAESANRLIDGVLGGAWYAHWHPGNVTTFSPQPALAPSQREATAAGLVAPLA